MRALGTRELAKYHALGNDYLVADAATFGTPITAELARHLCDRHMGVGSDGVLLRIPSKQADVGLRIFNPDGSEAEKSGNGLRIFARFLHDFGYVKSASMHIETAGGVVQAHLTGAGPAMLIRIDMGRASFLSTDIAALGPARDMLQESLSVEDEVLTASCVSVGNPHCVLLVPRLDVTLLRRLGPRVEHHALFPKRINMQLAQLRDRENVDILIWERGAGETLASGSSSCAVAAALHRLGLVDASVDLHMPGGVLHVDVGADMSLALTGPATPVCRVQLLP